jgi:hypothetical protein
MLGRNGVGGELMRFPLFMNEKWYLSSKRANQRQPFTGTSFDGALISPYDHLVLGVLSSKSKSLEVEMASALKSMPDETESLSQSLTLRSSSCSKSLKS